MTVQTWKWNADAFVEVERLNRFGAQGWEVERVDRLARFVSRRPAEGARRWEYRRAWVPGGQETAEGPAAEGWQPCGRWSGFAYYKRPAGELTTAPPAPSRSIYWSARFFILMAALLAVIVGVPALTAGTVGLLGALPFVTAGLLAVAAWAGRVRAGNA